jgi:hypothetical protein
LCGATQGAKTAANRHSAAVSAASMAAGDMRKLCQTSLSKKRSPTPGAALAVAAGSVIGSRPQWPVAGRSMRSRGSTAKYSRSTTRLMSTKMSAIRHR